MTDKLRQTDRKEMHVSEMVPYSAHYDDVTVLTKEYGLVQVIKLDGLYFESCSAEKIQRFEEQRTMILNAIAASNRGIYVHLIRRKVHDYPEYSGGTWFARLFNQAWKSYYQQRAFYVNDIYITIVVNPFRHGVPGVLDRLVTFFSGRKVTQHLEQALVQQAKEIHEVGRFLMQAFAEYGPRQLQVQHLPQWQTEHISRDEAQKAVMRFRMSWTAFLEKHGDHLVYEALTVLQYLDEPYTEIGSFFYYLINLEEARVPVSTLPLCQLLAMSWIDTQLLGNTLAIHHGTSTRLAAVLSMAQWPAKTSSAMLDDFLHQPTEFIVTQSFFFTDRISAEHGLRQERRRLTVQDQAGEASQDTADITQGLQALTSGQSVNGLHHLSILVHCSTNASSEEHFEEKKQQALQRLDDDVTLMQNAFVGLGVKPVREWFATETFFWSQLPGQAEHFIGRRGAIQSRNVAGFVSLHNFATGRLHKNLWGDAIMPFETESGTAYYFNFHREMEGMVAGHTAFTADTGAGKTTLLSALIAMADKASPRVFWFDHRGGAAVFMHAMGALYTTLNAQACMHWNPFQLPDTPENRHYLVELLTLMCTCHGGSVNAEDIACFQMAVYENYLLPYSDRRLRNVVWCFGHGVLAQEMKIWHGANGEQGAYAQVFDNAQDHINLETCRHYCFEMQHLMKDNIARPELAVMLSYPFHCIEQALDGSPCILVLEEGQHLVKHAYWREKIDYYMMQIRRKNGIVIFVTPDTKYLYCETDTIQKQAATKIFLPNREAQYRDYVEALGLTESEFSFIRDTPAGCRKFLIRRGNESIKAIFDLSALPEFIPVLSSNDQGIALMHSIMDELQTTDPEEWVPVFMQRSIANNTHNLSGISSAMHFKEKGV